MKMETQNIFTFIIVFFTSLQVSTLDYCEVGKSNNIMNKARYDNYRLYRLHLGNDEHVNLLQELEEQSDSYTFYGHARKVGQDLTIMVAAHKISEIHDLMDRYQMKGQLLVSIGGNIF
jgi:hypothetical protein